MLLLPFFAIIYAIIWKKNPELLKYCLLVAVLFWPLFLLVEKVTHPLLIKTIGWLFVIVQWITTFTFAIFHLEIEHTPTWQFALYMSLWAGIIYGSLLYGIVKLIEQRRYSTRTYYPF